MLERCGHTSSRAADLELRAGCLAIARELAPAVPRGWLAGRLPRRWQALLARRLHALADLDHRWLGARQRAAVVAAGVPLLLYTVNDPQRARQLGRGVAAVFTDESTGC